MPLLEDIPIELPLPLEEMIQLPEPIKEVDKTLPNPLISHYYNKDEDLLLQMHFINHIKNTKDWTNIRTLEPTPFFNTSPPVSDAFNNTNKA